MRSNEAHLHVTGLSRYVDDLPAPEGMLHAQVYGSPVAHGRLSALEIGEALDQEGVVAVLTAGDIPGANLLGPIIQDEQLLAEGTVQYAGQPLAVVVAASWRQARRGLRCLRADIEPLPAVVDPREAFARGLVIDRGRTFEIGDVDGAWAGCETVVEGRCEVGRAGARVPGDATGPRAARRGRGPADLQFHPEPVCRSEIRGPHPRSAPPQGGSGRGAHRRRLRR